MRLPLSRHVFVYFIRKDPLTGRTRSEDIIYYFRTNERRPALTASTRKKPIVIKLSLFMTSSFIFVRHRIRRNYRFILNRQLNSLTCHAGLDPASPGHTWIHTFGSMRIICVFYCRATTRLIPYWAMSSVSYYLNFAHVPIL